MPQLHSSQIPPPKTWQEFEELCADLWQEIFESPNTELNGRTGQPQKGVDISGLKGDSEKWFGVQCKGKDGRYGDHHQVTETELIAEVEKAKKFTPKISHFILATTAPNDVKIQEVARRLTTKNIELGLFIVQVKSWDEIHREFTKFKNLIRKYYPNFVSQAEQLRDEVIEEIKHSLSPVLQSVSQLPESKLDDEFSKRIDDLRDLLNGGQPQTALNLLEKLKSSSWQTLSNYNKFRVITNIAACHLNIGNQKESARLFIEANEIEPKDEKSLCNLVIAYHLLGDEKEIENAAENAVKSYPSSTMAHRLRVTATKFTENDTPEKLVPAQLHHLPEICFAVGHAYLNLERTDDAIEWLEKGYQDKTNSFPEVKSVYATALLKKLYDQKHLSVGAQYNEDEKQKLNLVNTIFSSLWEKEKNYESILLNTTHITNLLLTKFLLNDIDSGVAIAKEALAKIKGDDHFIQQAAFILMDAGQFEEAIKIITQYYEKNESKWALLYVDALARNRQFVSALEVVQKHLNRKEDIDKKQSSLGIELQLLALVNKVLPQEKVDAALSEFPNSISLHTSISLAYTKANQLEKAVDFAVQAKSHINENTSYLEKLLVANGLFDLEIYEDAMPLYEELIVEYVDSVQLRNLIQCQYKCNYRRKLHDLLDSLPEATRTKGFYRLYAAAAYQVSGEYDKALLEHEAYLEEHPQDLRETLRWFGLCQRLDEQDKIIQKLKQKIDYESPSSIDFMTLAAFQSDYLDYSTGLKLAIETTLSNYDDPDVNMAYVQLFMSRTDEGDKSLDQSVVEIETNITIQNDRAGESSYFITDKNKIFTNPISVDHPISISCMGKKTGDIVDIQETPYTSAKYTIKSIVSLPVFLFQNILSNFSIKFPNYSKPFFKVNVAGTSEGEYDFSDFLKIIDEQAKHTTEILKDYETLSYPIFFVAKLLGKPPLDVWVGMQADPTKKIFCCVGTHDERIEALSLLKSKNTYIVDPLTLYNLFILNILDTIELTIGKLAVTQSCIDFYNVIIFEKTSNIGKKGGTFSKTNDGYVSYDNSDEDTESSIEILQSIVDWIANNCIIAPAVEDTVPSRSMKLLSEAFDPVFYDTLVAAEGSGYYLLSDDLRFRQISKFSCKIDGVWLQPVLIRALQDNIITSLEYADCLADLSQRGLSFVSVDSNSLIKILKSNEWRVTSSAVSMLSTLGEEQCDLRSSFSVIFDVLSSAVSSDNFENVVYAALNGITRNYCHSESENIIIAFIRIYLKLGGEGQHKLSNYFLNAIYKWCQGHFIGHIFFKPKDS